MKGKSVIIKVIILAAVLVFLLNPSLNPFLGAESKATVSAQLQETFGVLAGGTAGVFSAPKIITLLALIAAVFPADISLMARAINMLWFGWALEKCREALHKQ